MAFVFGCLAFKLRLRSTPLLSLSSLPFIYIDTPLFPLVRAAVGEVKAQFEAVFRIVCRSKVVPFFSGELGREEPFRLKKKKMPISISYLRKGKIGRAHV